MKKKEFVAKYPVNRTQKNMKIISELALNDKLTVSNYCSEIITEKAIAAYSGLNINMVYNTKKSLTAQRFIYDAIREKCVLLMVKEYENA